MPPQKRSTPARSRAKPRRPISEIEMLLRSSEIEENELRRLRRDKRAGVRALLDAFARRSEKAARFENRYQAMLELEREAWTRGVEVVAGVDEAGVGPLAGPVVAAAVILGDALGIKEIDDSKRLDPAVRERLAVEIRARATAVAVGIATFEEIDTLNIYHAGLLAMRRAVEALSSAPQYLLVDARKIPGVQIEQGSHVKGDARSLSIAAASIIAKTSRDAMMTALDIEHPGYGFARHKGYATREHFQAIDRLGICPIHRRSYPILQDFVNQMRLPFLTPASE
ncbi:MAG TPA: ribonuclease HII [Candidatus Binatia bacterium]|nr:ribonuclease HII [Candidatus Binatia bacterium]